MRLIRIALSTALSFSLALPVFALTHTRRGPTSPAKPAATTSHTASSTTSQTTSKTTVSKTSAKRTKKTTAHKLTGPRSMDDQRATQIQQALIKGGYLTGEPSGHWDAQSQAAMQKLQADNGWQTKLIPDSRALIKLGLGPNSPTTPQTTASISIAKPPQP